MTFGKICVRAVPLVLVLFCGTVRPPATPASELDTDTLAANRQLDRKFLDGHAMKSSESLVSLFSSRRDVVFIAPSGTINRGREAIRASFDYFFSLLDEIHGEIVSVSYFRVGDAVAAVGTEVFHRKRRDGISDERTVVWTDLRQRENGSWHYVFRHSHWPVATGAPSTTPSK
ncbi:MAG: hypothetical protein DMF59_15215 [Acidobacteria bacterium]|nr:MAG: hypothetical protein DMF59_15215 [Acidobacteriota bacterium]